MFWMKRKPVLRLSKECELKIEVWQDDAGRYCVSIPKRKKEWLRAFEQWWAAHLVSISNARRDIQVESKKLGCHELKGAYPLTRRVNNIKKTVDYLIVCKYFTIRKD